MTEEEIVRLHAAVQSVLGDWIDRLAAEARRRFSRRRSRRFGRGWPSTAGTASPARSAASPVQRIVYAENEANYCATCQTGGKLLADRALSQLLRGDWPRTLEELEERKRSGGPRASRGG